jgi:2-C-methyl-D-erythritol 2,4-cyclodiphosphate synthase
MKVRVGQGFDFHPFSRERVLVLGGVEIPDSPGLAGHSDADAVLHAVTDALLGAAGLEDIGSFFPDDDPRYRGISSSILLERACSVVRERGFRVGNIDVTVLAEKPRIKPYASLMEGRIAEAAGISPEDVAVKATTMEGKGMIGRGEGIAAMAVALIYREEAG